MGVSIQQYRPADGLGLMGGYHVWPTTGYDLLLMEPSEERSEVPSREEGTYQVMVCALGEVTTEHELLTLESRGLRGMSTVDTLHPMG